MMNQSGSPVSIPSHLRLFLIVLAIVFLAEAVVMSVLPLLFPASEDSFLATLTDALMLVLLISPFLWRLIVIPLRTSAITEHARAATIIATASDAIITINSQGLVQQFNHAADRIFGYQEKEMLGRDLLPLIPERYSEAHRRGMEHLSSGSGSQIVGKTLELSGLRKDGAEFPLELSISSWEAGKETFFTGIIRDISERKEMEQQIERDQNRLAVLHNISMDTVSSLDLNAVLTGLLDKVARLLPYSGARISVFDSQTGQLACFVSHGLDEKALQEMHEKSGGGLHKPVLEKRGPVWIKNVPKDSPLPAAADYFRKHDLTSYIGLPMIAKDELVGVLSFVTKAEQEFTADEVEFLSTIADQAAIAIHNANLYEQAKKQAADLEKANQIQADFAAMIAHDLRSPLTSVVSTATMLEDGLFGPVNEEQKKWLGKIENNVGNLVDLVNDFLDLSKLEAGHISLAKEDVDLSLLIQNCSETYLPIANSRGIMLQSLGTDPVHCQADPRRLDQVLNNLLSNALKFTAAGGRIEVGASQENRGHVALWVKDTGVGVPREEIGTLFQKYKQTASGKNSQHKGTGLGLVICKMIVEAHGGQISVESEAGKGSTFIVKIPLEF